MNKRSDKICFWRQTKNKEVKVSKEGYFSTKLNGEVGALGSHCIASFLEHLILFINYISFIFSKFGSKLI